MAISVAAVRTHAKYAVNFLKTLEVDKRRTSSRGPLMFIAFGRLRLVLISLLFIKQVLIKSGRRCRRLYLYTTSTFVAMNITQRSESYRVIVGCLIKIKQRIFHGVDV